MKVKWTYLALAIALMAGISAFAALAATHTGPPGHGPKGLRVSGHVTDLYPGARKRMRVKVSNPFDHAVKVRSVRARVRAVSRRLCSRGSLVVSRSRRPLSIPAHRARRVWLGVFMRAEARDSCQGAKFKLRFRTSASRSG
jgi:hypothetical protein